MHRGWGELSSFLGLGAHWPLLQGHGVGAHLSLAVRCCPILLALSVAHCQPGHPVPSVPLLSSPDLLPQEMGVNACCSGSSSDMYDLEQGLDISEPHPHIHREGFMPLLLQDGRETPVRAPSPAPCVTYSAEHRGHPMTWPKD